MVSKCTCKALQARSLPRCARLLFCQLLSHLAGYDRRVPTVYLVQTETKRKQLSERINVNICEIEKRSCAT